jgi:alkanesulfonate monooxygenase SsuD/methylene tetrahydromethanopterin reductase-like flavin-dependent oxidoreductase (luciferase family)
MTSKFGLLVAQTLDWQALKSAAALCEELQFDSFWVADHFANPFVPSDWMEAWSVLAGLAESTNTIRIGSLVTNIVYRHPALLAKQAITVDRMSGGRLNLGIGAGGAPTCHRMTGTPYWGGKERQARLAEFVELVDQLLTNEQSSFSGKYYKAEKTLMRPRPVQNPRPPLIIAAHGPKSLSLAARHADTWSFSEPGEGLKGNQAAEAMRQMNDYLDEKAVAAGREPSDITRSYCCGYAASSAWNSLDEALSDIELYETAGINEFIFSYIPDSFVSSDQASYQGEMLNDIEVNQLFTSESDIIKLASALPLSS